MPSSIRNTPNRKPLNWRFFGFWFGNLSKLLYPTATQIPLCRRMLGVNPEPEFVNFQGIDFKESIPPAYVAWRAGTTTLFVVPV